MIAVAVDFLFPFVAKTRKEIKIYEIAASSIKHHGYNLQMFPFMIFSRTIFLTVESRKAF